MSEARLFGACLSYSCLVRTNFTGADLRYATIYLSNVREANFTRANMKGVDLSASNLERTIWYGNDLSSAILIRTDLRDAEGWGTGGGDIYNALLWNTTLPNGKIIEGPERYP